jgi:hypothetical protein
MTSRTARGSRSRQEEQGIAFEDLVEVRLESEALQEAGDEDSLCYLGHSGPETSRAELWHVYFCE